jgi:hypothetical protein
MLIVYLYNIKTRLIVEPMEDDDSLPLTYLRNLEMILSGFIGGLGGSLYAPTA